MKWNQYFAAALLGSILFLMAGAPLFSVLAGAALVAIINIWRTRRARQES